MRIAISYDTIQEYILENDLNESDSIILHPADYDNLAAEYAEENNIMIFRSFEILGIQVIEDTEDEVKKNQIMVVQMDAF
ncbi:hypothetical protein [Flavobacterium sp. AG291]|uniref:hypothetical protein n=1 Tax=Flavobacterium sp. AG291 TaxID=2184000 RepID=UPI000E0B3B14|nr:hypothetical protein [Flavobacterium sp. AG291]RDI06939.1 hypothetical protein DEU42_11338 [Flavobacterium sp. AG291]